MRAAPALCFVATAATAAVAVVMIGCPSQTEEPTLLDAITTAPDTEPTPEAGPVTGAPGGIKVVVGLAGTPPAPQPLDRKADPLCAKTEQLDPSVLVSEGKLQNVLVQIVTAIESDVPVPTAPVDVREADCAFEPRVSAARAGQKLKITNEDATMYMVQAYRGEERKSWFNTAQPPGAPPIERDLEPGMVQLKCGSHPWMAGYVAVTDHPFNAVTGAEGTVSFDLVPSASEPYTIETWHETLGKRELEVMVEPGKVSEVIVTYEIDGGK